jgi:tRNA pseudouridine38-40 synthase
MGLLLGEKVQLTGCGRTDTGVHARIFYAHFDTTSKKPGEFDEFLFRLNQKLPEDIVIHNFIPVKQEAHARFSALSRTYQYQIHRAKQAFHRDLAHYIYGEVNVKGMQEAADIMLEYKDFTSFSKVDTDTKTNICRIDQAEWKQEGDLLKFTIKADRFLRNMVRAIVGTMIEIGSGKLEPDGFRKIIESMDRSAAGTSAPAKGLFLTDIEYPKDIFL